MQPADTKAGALGAAARTTIVHCSDLHFGHGFLPERADRLISHINDQNPDAVVISGDLTMRARTEQFAAARLFLEKIKSPLLVIPGNHDVPLYNLWARLGNPFENYKQFTADLDDGPLILPRVCIYGLNTVNPLRHQQGRVRMREVAQMERWMNERESDLWRVAVVHQHFANVPGHERPGVMPRAEKVLERFTTSGIHAVLHGHVHYHHVVSSAEFFPALSRPIALVCAGTPTSLRARGESQANNYNILHFYEDRFEVHQCDWNLETNQFAVCRTVPFARTFYAVGG